MSWHKEDTGYSVDVPRCCKGLKGRSKTEDWRSDETSLWKEPDASLFASSPSPKFDEDKFQTCIEILKELCNEHTYT